MHIKNVQPTDIEMSMAELVEFLKNQPPTVVREALCQAALTTEVITWAPDKHIIEAFEARCDREPSVGLIQQLSAITFAAMSKKTGARVPKKLGVVA